MPHDDGTIAYRQRFFSNYQITKHIDIHSNKKAVTIINYKIKKYRKFHKSLSIDTIKKLPDVKGAVYHSDRGVHYTNKDFRSLLDRLGIRQSMSRKGNCWDNTCAESFFSHYKSECIYLNKKRLKGPSDVFEVTTEYFDYYINQRPQKRLGGLTPSEYRLSYHNF